MKITSFPRDGKIRGPVLPKDTEWCAKTRAWYLGWRRAPQAAAFEPQDWEALHRAALLHHILWTTASAVTASAAGQLSKQIAAIESQLGGTLEDRMRLRIHIEDDPVPEGAELVSARPAHDYRAALVS